MVDRLANGELRKRLGLPENLKVVPELYKMLLYEVGGRFTPHRDTEKAAGMFATLVIVLPSAHAGGKQHSPLPPKVVWVGYLIFLSSGE